MSISGKKEIEVKEKLQVRITQCALQASAA